MNAIGGTSHATGLYYSLGWTISYMTTCDSGVVSTITVFDEMDQMDEEAFREELRKLYDETYAKKHPPKKENPPDDPPKGGVREPRRPRPQAPSGSGEIPLGEDPQFVAKLEEAIEFFVAKGVN